MNLPDTIRYDLTTFHAFHNLVVALHDGKFLALGVALEGSSTRDLPLVVSGRVRVEPKYKTKRSAAYHARRREARRTRKAALVKTSPISPPIAETSLATIMTAKRAARQTKRRLRGWS